MAQRFEPVPLMALLKHPLCRLGLAPGETRRAAHVLEVVVLRATYLGRGLDDLAAALERAEGEMRARKVRQRAVRRLGAAEFKAARGLLARLAKAFAPMQTLLSGKGTASLQALARAHAATAEALTRPAGKTEDAASPWQDEAGETAALLFAGLMDPQLPPLDMPAADYPDFYRVLAESQSVRPRSPTHPRIFIWEPYESRLQQPDVVVLGSLNEGTWPQTPDPGPWLNRPMRQALGLPAPEERIGDAAHIFASLLGAERIYLTRAGKIDGAPTVPSRWLLRLKALLAGLDRAAEPDRPWLAWAQARSRHDGPVEPVRAPEPRPPIAARPRRLSVTTVEKWIANPYTIFAGRILGLEPLPPLGRQPDAALRGQIVHAVLSRFAQRFPERLPDDVCQELLAEAEAALAELSGSARVAAFWTPRFARFAAWFAETEPGRRQGIVRSHAEIDGTMVLEGPAGRFTLTARADRIDAGEDGLVITDYKGGANLDPLVRRAKAGLAPQLALEAAIAAAGGFAGLQAGPVARLRYISTSGGEPPGRDWEVGVGDVAAHAASARAGLERLIAAFDDPQTPYRALRRARFGYDFDEFAHLARVAEWSAETVEEA
jgi:ATP-dependent helicase/nuclease subunit B